MISRIYDDFSKHIDNIKKKAYLEISNYTEPLNALGLEYLEITKLLPRDSRPTGISLYLPLWIAKNSKINTVVAESLSLANFYLTLYLQLKDGIIDKTITDRKMFLLSDRLLVSYMILMFDLIGNNHTFWNYFNKSIEETLSFMADEETRLSAILTDNINDIENVILKSRFFECGSFLKPCVVACSILSNEDSRIVNLCNMIEFYHIGIKIMDDLSDWKEDLRNDNTTLFLNYVKKWKGTNDINQNDVYRFLVGSRIPIELTTIAIQGVKHAELCLCNLNYNYLKSFLRSERKNYEKAQEELRKKREQIIVQLCELINNFKKRK